MEFTVTEDLIDRIKDIIVSEPLELYEDDKVISCNFKLVESRYSNSDDNDEENRFIGSANMLLAASFLGYVMFKCKVVRAFSDEEAEIAGNIWSEVLNILKQDNFIRETEEIAREKIRVVIDNTNQ